MWGKTYTWDELREVSKAEAADLPPRPGETASSTSTTI